MFMMVFLQATVGMTFVCQSEMSWQLLDGLPWNGMHTTMHPSSWMSSRSSDFPSDALIYRSRPTMFTSHTHFWPSLDFFYKRKRNKEKKSGIKKCQYLPLQHKATSQRLDQIKTVSVLSNELFCDFRQVCLQWWWLSPGQSEDGSSVLLLALSAPSLPSSPALWHYGPFVHSFSSDPTVGEYKYSQCWVSPNSPPNFFPSHFLGTEPPCYSPRHKL